MKSLSLDYVVSLSPDIVVRKIDGEILIVPLTSRVAAGADHLFSLNESGREIWDLFDGSKNLKSIITRLEKKYSSAEIEQDVLGLTQELLKRDMIVVANPGAAASQPTLKNPRAKKS